jgi:uncharacterized protein YnzC (UPF0291/DUF896 family)
MVSEKRNPMVAWRDTRKKILTFFENGKKLTWEEIWQKAKKQKIHYSTFKKHMKKLTSTKIIKQEVDDSVTPAKIKYFFSPNHLLNEQSLELYDIVTFIEDSSRDFNRFKITQFGKIYFFDERGKNILEKLKKKRELSDIQLEISDIWKEEILNSYPKKEREILRKYERALMGYMWLHLHFQKDKLSEESIKNVEDVFGSSFCSFENAKKQVKSIDIFILPSTPEKLEEKARLEQFLEEYENFYNGFDEKVSNQPKIVEVTPSFGFAGYTRKAFDNFSKLPLEFQVDSYLGSKQYLEERKNTMIELVKHFGKKKVLYQCSLCGKCFQRRKKLEDHLTFDEKRSNPKDFIRKLDKAYYLKAIKLLDKKIKEKQIIEGVPPDVQEMVKTFLNESNKKHEKDLEDFIKNVAQMEGLTIDEVKRQMEEIRQNREKEQK